MADVIQVRRSAKVCNMFCVSTGVYTGLLRVCVMIACLSVSTGDYCKGHFDKCICTDESVVCRNETTLTDDTIAKLYPYIKDDVVNVTITGSYFKELPQNLLGSCAGESSLRLDKLVLLDISSNRIRDVHGKSLHCMRFLKTLNMSYNSWQVDFHDSRNGYFTNLPELVTLDLTDAFDDLFDGSIHVPKLESVFNNTNMLKLEMLHLASNEIWVFPASAAASLCHLKALKHLDLSNNYIGKPVVNGCMSNLEVLDLSVNMIPKLPQEFMDTLDNLTSLREIHLKNNQFHCDCSFIESHRWITNNDKIKNKDQLTCYEGYHSSYIDKPIGALSESDLKCATYEANGGSAATKVVMGIIFTVIGCTILGFLFINRNRMGNLFGGCKKRIPNISLLPHSGYSSVKEQTTIENI